MDPRWSIRWTGCVGGLSLFEVDSAVEFDRGRRVFAVERLLGVDDKLSARDVRVSIYYVHSQRNMTAAGKANM